MSEEKDFRVVFNYRRALREPKRIRQITDNYYLPFTIELIPALNFIIFLILTFLTGIMIKKIYPYAFMKTWFVFLVTIPSLFTWLVTKIKPEGKNIYKFIYDYFVYLFRVKIPKKKYCNGKEVEFMDKGKVTFKKCVLVVNEKNGESRASFKNNKKQFAINERGRRIRILSYKK